MKRKTFESFTCPQYGVVINTNIIKNDWREKYDEIINFILLNNRLPRKKNCTEYERGLWEFINSEHRALEEHNDYSNIRISMLEKTKSISESLLLEKWKKYILSILALFFTKNEFPLFNDNIEVEKKLHSIFNAIKGELLVADVNNRHRKISNYFFDFKEIIFEIAERQNFELLRIKAFVVCYGKLPSDETENIIEAKLSLWAKANLSESKKRELLLKYSSLYQKLQPSKNNELEELKRWAKDFDDTKHLGIIRSIKSIKKIDFKAWNLEADKFEDFLNLHSKNPSNQAEDETEKALGLWYDQQVRINNSNAFEGQIARRFDSLQARVSRIKKTKLNRKGTLKKARKKREALTINSLKDKFGSLK